MITITMTDSEMYWLEISRLNSGHEIDWALIRWGYATIPKHLIMIGERQFVLTVVDLYTFARLDRNRYGI